MHNMTRWFSSLECISFMLSSEPRECFTLDTTEEYSAESWHSALLMEKMVLDLHGHPIRFIIIIGASLSEPHIDHDNVPRHGECLYLSIYLCIYLAACSVCRLNVPENTPIQSITRSARAHWQLTPILDSKLQESTPEAWATLGTGILLRWQSRCTNSSYCL